MRNVTYTLMIGMVALLFSACKSGESISTDPADLRGDWQIIAINDTEIPQQARANHTVSFNLDGTVAGLAACNRFAGTYSAREEGRVTLNSVSATKVECESETRQYVDALTSASSFQVMGGDELKLTSSTSSNTLLFSKVVKSQKQ